MELIFNPYGEFQWSPEGPVSHIHSPHLHVGALGIFSDLLRSVQVLKREWGAESNGKLPHLSIPSKSTDWGPEFAVEDLLLSWTAALVPEFAVKDLPLGRILMMMMMITILYSSYDNNCIRRRGVVCRYLPSNPAAWVRFPERSGILISDLGLSVCPLSVFCPVMCPAEALTLSWPHIQKSLSLCICPVFLSKDCCSPYRHLTHGHLGCKSYIGEG